MNIPKIQVYREF